MWTLQVRLKTPINPSVSGQTFRSPRRETLKLAWYCSGRFLFFFYITFFFPFGRGAQRWRRLQQLLKHQNITDTGISKGTGTGDCSDSPARLGGSWGAGARCVCSEYKKVTRRPSTMKKKKTWEGSLKLKKACTYLRNHDEKARNYFGTRMEVRHRNPSRNKPKTTRQQAGRRVPQHHQVQRHFQKKKKNEKKKPKKSKKLYNWLLIVWQRTAAMTLPKEFTFTSHN